MTRTYTSIWLRSTIRLSPGWLPNVTAELPYKDQFAAPDFAITRELGDTAYLVTHVVTGESAEVPGANVRSATPTPAPKAAQQQTQQKGGKK